MVVLIIFQITIVDWPEKMSLYTKTALKKIKKDELIEMFLDLQAKKVDHMMDEVVEKCCTGAVQEVVEGLKKELEAAEHTIQYSNSTWQKSYEKLEEDYQKVCEERNARMNKEQEQKLQEENEYLKTSLQTTTSYHTDKYELLEAENEKLKAELANVKEKNEDLNRTLNDVNYVPFNPNYTEKAILEFIRSCPIKIVEKINQNEKLKKEKIPDDIISAFTGLTNNWWGDEEKFYSEIFEPEQEPEDIPTDKLEPCNYRDLRVLDEWFNKINQN